VRRLVQSLSNGALDVRSKACPTVEKRSHAEQARGTRTPRTFVQALNLENTARKEQEVGVAQDDSVERRLVYIANLEVAKTEEVAHTRSREDNSADLGRPQSHGVARKASSGEVRAIPIVDPAAQ